ncbi:MAG TPA: M20/M25/M40 family metallo-hydrolase [Terriglobales bacterium]|nr:M20/M25/M40 family metallo-hydrolase [Terriglobales bacterium]
MKPVFVVISICLLALAAAAQSPSDADRIISEAQKPSSIESNLRQLTDGIGGRVPGTPAMQRAIEWGVSAFKAAGADDVRTEEYTIPHSWAEGATQMNVVAPEPFRVKAISLGWAPALAPHRRVPIVDVGEGTAADFSRAGNLNGAIALVHSNEMKTWADLFAEYLNAPGIVDRAVQAKALAIAFQSTRPHDLMYRHTNAVEGEIERIPMVLVAREDAGRIARLLASGQKLFADLSIPNQIGGPIKAANVVAELRGSEQLDQFVLLGAHLDSWELGTGALDNGCNAALVVDALRTIKASGLRPRRTIRFALFTGEEEGMLGSRAYATSHRDELDKAGGVVVVDSGIGRITGFSLGGRKDLVSAVTPLVSPLQQFGAANLTTDAEWGTDNFDFMLEGVPTFVANQDEANYLINYHAESDTFDKVDIPELKKHVTEAAELTFALANTPQPVGPRLDHAQIETTLHETGLDEQLKTFGIWQEWQSGKRGRAK